MPRPRISLGAAPRRVAHQRAVVCFRIHAVVADKARAGGLRIAASSSQASRDLPAPAAPRSVPRGSTRQRRWMVLIDSCRAGPSFARRRPVTSPSGRTTKRAQHSRPSGPVDGPAFSARMRAARRFNDCAR